MKEWDFRYDLLPLKNKLFRLALRITLNKVEAEDITQDVLIKVWSKREELSKVENLESYCLTTCRNLALDRKERKDSQNISLEDQGIDAFDEAGTPHDDIVYVESRKIIAELFAKLPEKQRTVMQLRDVESKSYAEIAKIMAITEAQVKVSLFRARQKIKQEFEKINRYGL